MEPRKRYARRGVTFALEPVVPDSAPLDVVRLVDVEQCARRAIDENAYFRQAFQRCAEGRAVTGGQLAPPPLPNWRLCGGGGGRGGGRGGRRRPSLRRRGGGHGLRCQRRSYPLRPGGGGRWCSGGGRRSWRGLGGGGRRLGREARGCRCSCGGLACGGGRRLGDGGRPAARRTAARANKSAIAARHRL